MLCGHIVAAQKMKKMIRNYSTLKKLKSFEDRYNYLKLKGNVGESTFGFDRYINQNFYKSKRWREVRDIVITRDNGCDLGSDGFEIYDKILIHHMNPISLYDIEEDNDDIFNPEYLICVSNRTHQAIHYGDENLLPKKLITRKRNDTVPWKQ